MALKTYCASAHRKKDLQVEVKARDFSIIVDEPENSGGTNTGMNPVEMLLCSIGACQTITAVIFADFYGITLEDIQVEIPGEMDSDGFFGNDPSIRPGFQKLHSVFHIKSTAPKMQIVQLLKMVEKSCPVGDSISHGVVLDEPELDLIS